MSVVVPALFEISAGMAGYLIALGLAPEIAAGVAAAMLAVAFYYGASNLGGWALDLGAYLADILADPIVLDLDGNGVELVPLANSGTMFDLDGDGVASASVG